ncbi:hypothetical protein GYMLUDRAFT_97892 [Collybiopsis luxurians FD-317 M1]|uniref:Uncharacterized protein n=1 Tax=Collybiopsis luxurians FD-317 M1 TaxID=944289 RepID=A0A0D0CTM8_9AGAR|nr:hypothetical protein GYMLUDRAFT_97892 [Collybiopsis luxurians FD-317 M1]
MGYVEGPTHFITPYHPFFVLQESIHPLLRFRISLSPGPVNHISEKDSSRYGDRTVVHVGHGLASSQAGNPD